VVINNLLYYC